MRNKIIHQWSVRKFLPARCAGPSQNPSILAGDYLVCEETEDLDPFEDDPGHPQAVFEASLIPPLSQLSRPDSPRAAFLPFHAIHGLMSRRF